MHKWIKAGLLMALLVVPASVFLFLQGFGKNHYSLRTYFPLTDSTTGKYVIRKKMQYNRLVDDTLFHTVPPVTLTDQQGKPTTGTITAGKVCVAFFLTRCANVCPQVLSQMGRVQELFIDNPNVVLVCYGVSPAPDCESDSPAYAKQYRARPGKWYFLTGTQEYMNQLAQQGYKISDANDKKQTQGPTNVFIPQQPLVLVDRDKHIRGYYDGTDPKEVDRLILEMQILLSTYAN